jgi:putative Mn2+ efflux pump MntP
MNLITILFLAIALATDAFAVSIAGGIGIKNLRIKHALILASWFGFFQALMPLAGWLGGVKLQRFICGIDHWVIFGLLSFIGCKMIYEALHLETYEKKVDPMDKRVLFALSVATSIDAFAAGVGLALLGVPILRPVIIIGLITFTMSFAGVLIGDRGSHFFEKKIEVLAGVILITIGLKVLITHLLEG